MAERLAYLEAVIGADITQFRKAMRDVRNDVGILSETVGGLGKLGRTATFAISAPLVTLGSFAVQAASDFDGAMRNINSIAGISESQLQELSGAVREFGATTRGGAVESANALYTVFSAGITNTALAMDTMKVATKTAEAGLANMEVTTEALVASMLSYGTANMTAERASNALTAMVQVGVGSMENFAGAVASALPAAASLDVEIEDLYGSMAFMTQRGFSAAKAATSMNSAMTALVKPTEAMEGAMRSLGVRGAEQLIEKYGSLGEAIKALVNTTDGSSESIAKLFSNVRGKRFVDLLASDFGAFEGAMAEFDTLVDGATDRAHAEQMKSFAAQWDLMTSAVEGASIAIGSVLLPVLLPVVQGIANIFNSIANLNPELVKMGVAFAGAVTASAPMLWLVTSLINPVGLLLGAVAGLGVAFASNFGDAQTAVESFVSSTPVLEDIRQIYEGLFAEIDPPTAEDLIPDQPVSIQAKELVTIESGDTVWDFFIADNAGMTWTEFKEAWVASNGTLDLFVGDLVEIPNANLTDRVTEAMIVEAGGLEAWIAQQEKIELQSSDFFLMNDPVGNELPFETKLMLAIGQVKDKLPEALNTVKDAVIAWADTNIGFGLEQISNLFVGTFDTNLVSNAVGSLFDFNFEDTFPNISSGLNTLINRMGTWFIEIGVPTISKGVGRFVGEVGVMIGKGFGLIGDFISGGGVQEGAGVLGESVVDPFLEGFSEATEGNDVNTGIDSLLTGIAGAIAIYAVANYGIFTVASMAIGKAISLSMAGVKLAGGFGVGILKSIASSLAGSAAGTAISGAFVGLANAIQFQLWYAVNSAFIAFKGTSIVQGLTLWASGLVAQVGGALATAWATATASGGAIAGALTLGAPIIAGVAVGLVVDFFLPESVKETIRDWIGNTIAPLFGGADWDAVLRSFEDSIYEALGRDDLMSTPPTITVTPPIKLDPAAGLLSVFDNDMFTLLSEMDNAMQADILNFWNANESMAIPELAFLVESYNVSVLGNDPTKMTFPEEVMSNDLLHIIVSAWTASFEDDGDGLDMSKITDINDDDLRLAEDGAGIYKAVADGVEAEATANPVTVRVWEDGELEEYATTAGTSVANDMIEAVSTGFANGDLTAESFNTDFLIPFKDNWSATFGEGSEVQLATASWVESFATSTTSVTAMALFAQVASSISMGVLATNVENASNTIVDAMTSAKGSIADFLTELQALASVATNLEVKVEVSGNINAPVGVEASASGGWAEVPSGGAVTQLHPKEMVLPATLAENIRNLSSIPASLSMGSNGSVSNTSNTQNTIIIDGEVGVDTLLEELERRGVYL